MLIAFHSSSKFVVKINFNQQAEFHERAHGDGILINTESPEAFEEVFWRTFKDSDQDTRIKFKNYVNLIKFKNKKIAI